MRFVTLLGLYLIAGSINPELISDLKIFMVIVMGVAALADVLEFFKELGRD